MVEPNTSIGILVNEIDILRQQNNELQKKLNRCVNVPSLSIRVFPAWKSESNKSEQTNTETLTKNVFNGWKVESIEEESQKIESFIKKTDNKINSVATSTEKHVEKVKPVEQPVEPVEPVEQQVKLEVKEVSPQPQPVVKQLIPQPINPSDYEKREMYLQSLNRQNITSD